jgi:hypothetical protein
LVGLSDLVDTKELWSNSIEIGLLIGGLVFASFSKKIKGWLEKQTNIKFERSINTLTTIRDSLAELRGFYDADRVMLYQLHNGQYYFSGEGADKLSLTHFVLKMGVAVPDRVGTKLQNIPITYWPEMFRRMTAEGYFFERWANIIDPALATQLTLSGVEAIIMGPIKDGRGYWRGVLLISFMKEVDEKDVKLAQEYGRKLGDLLHS